MLKSLKLKGVQPQFAICGHLLIYAHEEGVRSDQRVGIINLR